MSYFRRLLGSLALLLVLPGVALAQESDAAWDVIRPQIFGERAIEDGSSVVELVAPKRAEDAALVPIDVHVRVREGAATVKAVTLVIDENPAPLAATFTFGEDRRSFSLSTRMRVNSYSFVRAIAETSDGKLHMHAYVKAAGGCSAPAARHGGGESQSRADALSRVPESRGGADPDPSSDLFGALDGPGDAPLHAGVVDRDHHGCPRRQAHLPHGHGDLDQRGPDVSLQLRAERRADYR